MMQAADRLECETELTGHERPRGAESGADDRRRRLEEPRKRGRIAAIQKPPPLATSALHEVHVYVAMEILEFRDRRGGRGPPEDLVRPDGGPVETGNESVEPVRTERMTIAKPVGGDAVATHEEHS